MSAIVPCPDQMTQEICAAVGERLRSQLIELGTLSRACAEMRNEHGSQLVAEAAAAVETARAYFARRG